MEPDAQVTQGMDLGAMLARMHSDWVDREEQFRICVSQLQAAALAATEEADSKNEELNVAQKRISELEARIRQLKSNDECKQEVIQQEGNEVVELLEYLNCSYGECQESLIELQDSLPSQPSSSRQLLDYVTYIELPLAFHATSRRIASGEQSAVEQWHAQVVEGIRLADISDLTSVARNICALCEEGSQEMLSAVIAAHS